LGATSGLRRGRGIAYDRVDVGEVFLDFAIVRLELGGFLQGRDGVLETIQLRLGQTEFAVCF
jgi:hypothetical protein